MEIRVVQAYRMYLEVVPSELTSQSTEEICFPKCSLIPLPAAAFSFPNPVYKFNNLHSSQCMYNHNMFFTHGGQLYVRTGYN